MEPLYPWEYLFSSLIRERGREVPGVLPVEEEVGSGSAAGTSPFWLAVGSTVLICQQLGLSSDHSDLAVCQGGDLRNLVQAVSLPMFS